jgi:iron-sulfur cluster repair protein YtfE (RIC family)
VFELFKQLQRKTNSAANCEQLFAQLREELELHTHAEEQVFYPILQAVDITQDLTFDAMEDHRLVKELLAELTTTSIGSPEWDERIEILKENVEEHVEEEESDLFDAARQLLTPDQVTELAEHWQTAKQEQMARSVK